MTLISSAVVTSEEITLQIALAMARVIIVSISGAVTLQITMAVTIEFTIMTGKQIE